MGQGPGPGPLGPGAWVPLGPRCGIRVENVTTYSQASYLQSGKLPTVRHAPNRSIDMHPKGIDMHPKVSIDLHPTTAYFAPNRSIDMHPKGAYMHPKVAAYMHHKLSFFENL